MYSCYDVFHLLTATAQISFHNCHIPFIASKAAKEACSSGETCRLPPKGEPAFTDEELDYYACLNELDNAIGLILDSLKNKGYYENTMVCFRSHQCYFVPCSAVDFFHIVLCCLHFSDSIRKPLSLKKLSHCIPICLWMLSF